MDFRLIRYFVSASLLLALSLVRTPNAIYHLSYDDLMRLSSFGLLRFHVHIWNFIKFEWFWQQHNEKRESERKKFYSFFSSLYIFRTNCDVIFKRYAYVKSKKKKQTKCAMHFRLNKFESELAIFWSFTNREASQ